MPARSWRHLASADPQSVHRHRRRGQPINLSNDFWLETIQRTNDAAQHQCVLSTGAGRFSFAADRYALRPADRALPQPRLHH